LGALADKLVQGVLVLVAESRQHFPNRFGTVALQKQGKQVAKVPKRNPPRHVLIARSGLEDLLDGFEVLLKFELIREQEN
jgi:hypothetical protein